ncbi:MAG: hypothetical protein NXH91_19240 [Phyllobacteriaceae bacterium]|jgi:hypothetical protein|nr:hypothetical protein [Phyllobacteriaceae bacterium]
MTLRFVSRNDAFASYPWLARNVMDWQSAALDPVADRYEPGDEVFMELDDEDATVLTSALADQLNNERDAELSALRDDFRAPLPDGNSTAFTVAEPPGTTPEQSATMAGPAFSALCEALRCDEIAILPITRTPILVQHNEHSAAAHKTLEGLGLKPDFDGAIVGPPDTIVPLVAPLFRIARCDAGAPYIVFGLKGAAIAGAFCKYVNFHFDSYDGRDSARLLDALARCGFVVAQDGICRERFSATGTIQGRRLDLNL